MSEGDGMAEVTEGDRKAAVALLRTASADDLIHPTAPWAQPLMVDRIAAALAEEREKVRDQFCALLAVSPTLVGEAGDMRGYLVSVPLLEALGITSEDIGHAAEEG